MLFLPILIIFLGYVSSFHTGMKQSQLLRRSLRSARLQMNIIDAEPVNENEPRRSSSSSGNDELSQLARRLGLDNEPQMPPGQFEDPNEERVYKLIIENYQKNPNYNPLEDRSLLQELRAPPLGKPDKISVILTRLLNKFGELDTPGGRMNRQQWEEFLNSFPTRADIDKEYLEQVKDTKGFFAQIEELLQEIEADERETRARSGGEPELSPREFFATLKKLAPGYLENPQKYGLPFNNVDLNLIPDNWDDIE